MVSKYNVASVRSIVVSETVILVSQHKLFSDGSITFVTARCLSETPQFCVCTAKCCVVGVKVTKLAGVAGAPFFRLSGVIVSCSFGSVIVVSCCYL